MLSEYNHWFEPWKAAGVIRGRLSMLQHQMRYASGFIVVFAVCLLPFYPSSAERGSKVRFFKVGYQVLDLDYLKGGEKSKLTVAVWYPTTAKPQEFTYSGPTKGTAAKNGPLAVRHAPYPLMVFSHGYGGFGLSSVFFTEHLAAQGWIVAAPDHHDRHTVAGTRSGRNKNLQRRAMLSHAQEIGSSSPSDRAKYLYRLDEMQTALNGMIDHPVFGRLIDTQRIAVGGHSFGGYTALGVSGTIKKRHDPRVKAVLLFSTGAGGYLYRESELKNVRVPVMMFMGGRERDQARGAHTMLELQNKILHSISAPKYFLEIKGASHFSFNNQFRRTVGAWLLSGNEEQFEVIRRYSIAFLERHVAGRRHLDHVLAHKDPMLSAYSVVGTGRSTNLR